MDTSIAIASLRKPTFNANQVLADDQINAVGHTVVTDFIVSDLLILESVDDITAKHNLGHPIYVSCYL